MFIASPHPPIELLDKNVWEFIFERPSLHFPNYQPIYIDALRSDQYSWAEVKSAASIFGGALQSRWNWTRGDVLALFSPNCIDYPIVVFGTLLVGGILSPVNPNYTIDELVFQLRDCGAKAIATSFAGLGIVREAAGRVGIQPDRIVLLDHCDNKVEGIDHWSSWQHSTNIQSLHRPAIDPQEDLALIVYSSGTTGLPKGVMLSHHNIITNLLQIAATDEGNLVSQDHPGGRGFKIGAVVPFFHIYGLATLVLDPVYRGLTTIVLKRYSLETFLMAVQTFRVTYTFLVPPIILQIVKSALTQQYDITSLRMIVCSAAPIKHNLIEELYQKYNIPVRQVYGLSETSPGAIYQTWHECRTNIGSVGKLLPNMEARFLDEDGKGLEIGRTGEICLRGPNIFRGYLHNPGGTAECLSDDKWFRTGDIGHVDKHGNFFITDRAKELIKYKGSQVAPAELEGALISHADVADVAVVGIYSNLYGSEVPRAYVVLKPQIEPTPGKAEEIRTWLQTRLSPHKQLRGGVEFTSQIPRNPSGKILRRVIRAAIQESETRSGKAKL